MRAAKFLFAFEWGRLHAHAVAMNLTPDEIRSAVRAALAEDVGSGDVTTLATVPEDSTCRAVMRARESLVVAGLAFAETAFRELSPGLAVHSPLRDGAAAAPGEVLLTVAGPTRAILSAERVALNFVQRLSGEIARVITDAEVKNKLFAIGIEAVGNTPAEFAAMIRDETAKWAKVVKDARLPVE